MPTQLTTGALVTAANWNTIPAGVLGYAQTTTSQGSITSTVDLTGLSVTVTAIASRRIRVSGFVSIGADAADNTIRVGIWQLTNELNSSDVNSSVANVRYGTHVSVVVTPSAGSVTYRIRAGRVSGAGSVGTGSSTIRPSYILVEDLGPV